MTSPWRDPRRDEEVLKATPNEWTSAADIARAVRRDDAAVSYRLRKLVRLGRVEVQDTINGLRLRTPLYRRKP